MSVMAKKKPDRHLANPFMFRMRDDMRAQLDRLAERNATTVTAEITTAIRRHLEANDLWPPAQRGKP
jgi:predicted transcriptional regulator